MEIKVISEKENPLLKRKEILASIDYEGGPTPSKADLQKILADHFKANINNVEISKIMSEFGMPKGKVWIKIWQEKEVPIYAELKKKKEKKKPAEKPKEKEARKEPEAPKPEAKKPEVKPKTKIKPEEPVVKEESKEKAESSKEQAKEEKKE